VFEADNLTDPVAAFEGTVYAPRGAFYVKVTGDLYALRHTGTTQADALVLSPSKPQSQTQTTKTYYRVHQRKLASGAKQAMKFMATGPAAKIRLGTLETPTQPNATLTLDPATSPVSAEEQNLSFTVEGEGTFEVRWDSSYSLLSLRTFKVVDQNDTGGVDEPHLYVRVDGGAEREINLGDQDEGQAKILPAWSRDIGFADTVTVRLSEEDGGLNGGWDDYGTRTITPGATHGSFFYLDSSARYDLNYTVVK
jgi:hypothetical protein